MPRSRRRHPHPLRFFAGAGSLMVTLAAYTPGSPVSQAATIMERDMKIAVSLIAPPQNATMRINVPFHKQEHSLSCEIASLRSALLALNIDVPESILLSALPRDATVKAASADGGMMWGDPEKGFVGNIDGRMPSTGYGVHAPPIQEMAKLFYADATMIRADDAAALRAAIDAHHPVLVWTPIGDNPQPTTWNTPEGTTVNAALYEHTAVVNGYRLNESGDIVEVFLVDPLTGYRSETWEEFVRRTAMLGNQAIELSPKSFIVSS